MTVPKVVKIEVQGQSYPIRTELDPGYVQELADFVESRMSKASRRSPSSDSVALAILTALNITDELFRTRSVLADRSGTVSRRAEDLEKIVDQALALAE